MNDVNDGCSATGERITVNIFSLQGRSPRSPTVRAPDRRYGGRGFDSYPNVITVRQTTDEPRNRLIGIVINTQVSNQAFRTFSF